MARLRVFAWVLVLTAAASAAAQTPLWSGILDTSRAIDWSSVGATISTTRTQCVTTACATVTGGSVTATTINAALASAPKNSYVLLPAGTFTISSTLTFNHASYVTLRGAGSNATFLAFSGTVGSGNCAGHDVCASSTDTNYAGGPSNTATFSGTNGTSGTYTRGATSILLSSVTNLAVGAPIVLDQIDDQKDNGGLYVGCELPDGSPACYSGANSNGFERGSSSLSTIRGQQQIVNVTNISGSGPYTVGITPGLYAANWATAKSPGAWWATNPVYADAVEDISLDHTNGGDGITFFNCTGCWVARVRSITTSSGGTGWYHVGFSICNHCTVRDSYHFGYQGDDYGFANDIGSDNLWENNIGQYPAEEFFTNSDCEGCVAAYNFSVNPYYGASTSWLSQSNFYHGVVLFSLQEGNIGVGLYADSFHGSHVLNTQFRNRWDGRQQNNGVLTSSSTVALRLNPAARYDNAIGNVLGTSGYHTNYKATPSSGSLYVSAIGAGVYPEIGTTDALVNTTAMFWGNWDPATNDVRWCGNSNNTGFKSTCASASEVPSGLSAYANAVPSSTTLPDSFFHATKPTWWTSSKAWPSIGPDVTGGNVGQCTSGTYMASEALSSTACSGGGFTANPYVVSNPAMDCYFNVMGGKPNGTGSALAFNASACYATSTTQPGSPTNLSGTVQTN